MLHRWIINPLNDEQKQCKNELVDQLHISPPLCELLVQRGITSMDEAKDFFRPQLSHLHDPFLMKDMDKAVKRLETAIGRKEKILVYGDYDVDGTTAVALVYKFLQQFSSSLGFYVPDRYGEGYGVSYKGIDYAAENGYTLIIVLDCGIKAVEKVRYAKEKGIDIIICDHHNPDNELPEAVAVLDAKRPDNTYPYEHLSGCGVGFKFMQAFAQSNRIPFKDKLEPLLDLLAVSIASDIVPMTGENRVLMYYGLRQLNNKPSTGLKAIIEECGLAAIKEKHRHNGGNYWISTSDIVFKIGPRINASGRMKSGMEAVELLISKDDEEARQKSEQIGEYNSERKILDQETTKQAENILRMFSEKFKDRNSIVVYDKTWEKGVIGIVASRLSEKYYRPSVVLTMSQEGDLATGSARSIVGFDLYSAIDSCRDLLENFGGHTYAAGLTLKQENVKEFARRFDEYVSNNITEEQKIPPIEIDTELLLSQINQTFYNILQHFSPFGPENMKPVFVTRGLMDNGRCSLVGHDNSHLRLNLVEPSSGCTINGIAFAREDFKPAEFLPALKQGRAVDVCYTLDENEFHGQKSLQLMVKDIKFSE